MHKQKAKETCALSYVGWHLDSRLSAITGARGFDRSRALQRERSTSSLESTRQPTLNRAQGSFVCCVSVMVRLEFEHMFAVKTDKTGAELFR